MNIQKVKHVGVDSMTLRAVMIAAVREQFTQQKTKNFCVTPV